MARSFVDALSLLDDASLRRMERRAYADAARSFQEARANRDKSIAGMLRDAALSADAYWHELRAEIARRESVERCDDCGHAVDIHDLRAMDGCAGCDDCNAARRENGGAA